MKGIRWRSTVIIGAALLLALGWFLASIDCNFGAWPAVSTPCRLLKVAYDWQNIMAGAFAIVAALIGGRYIQRQINVSESQERARVLRQFTAARAVLPLALSSLSQYAQQSAMLLRGLHNRASGEAVPQEARQGIALPSLPDEATKDLRSMVEAADQGNVGLAIAALLSDVQVQASRLAGLRNERHDHVVVLAFLEEIIVNTAQIYARASALFDFARRRVDEVGIGELRAEELHSALRNLGFHDGRFDRIYETVSRRARQADGN
jgi:hypothetical protein